MPIGITTTAAGDGYAMPFLGDPVTANLKIDISTLTTAEVDDNGFIKPGVPFQATGALVSGADQTIYGVTVAAVKIPGRTDSDDLGTDTSDPIIAVAVSGVINRDIAEDNLGRAYSANELTALVNGGFKLTTT